MRERIKTVILTVLALCTLVLAWLTWAYEPALLEAFPENGEVSEAVPERPQLAPAASPVQIAQKRGGERSGALWDHIAIEYATQLLERTLREALGSAGTPRPVRIEQWAEALSGDSVYLRYAGAIPLQALGAWYSTDCPLEAGVRRLALCAEDGVLRLYYEDEQGDIFVCDTAAHLELPDLGLGLPCFFAFERAGAFERPEPLTLMPEEMREWPVLLVSDCPDMVSAAAPFLRALGMDPESPTRYENPDGTVSFVDFRRQCRISPDGRIYYNNPMEGENLLTPRTEPDILGLIEGTRDLCAKLSGTLGEADWELQEVIRSGQTVALRYGVRLGGCPVYGANRAYAQFAVTDGRVEEAFIYVKSYRRLEEASALLPLEQALAAASPNRDFSVELGYADAGDAELAAQWMLGG